MTEQIMSAEELISQMQLDGDFTEKSVWVDRIKMRDTLLTAAKDKEIYAAQSLVTAWENIFHSIEAHLQDRIACNDQSSPGRYLSIIRNEVSTVIDSSSKISNARWADYHRQAKEIETLKAALAQHKEG